jgi:hypothetical protein
MQSKGEVSDFVHIAIQRFSCSGFISLCLSIVTVSMKSGDFVELVIEVKYLMILVDYK